MARMVWLIALLVVFGAGWLAGNGFGGTSVRREAARDRETVERLRDQVATLQARLRARDDLVALRQSGAASMRSDVTGRMADMPFAPASARPRESAETPSAPAIERAAAASSGRTASSSPTVQAALDRFYRYLEATNDANGRQGWRQARELVEQLKAMGPPAGQALMQVLASGNDSDERRAAARLLGQLQVAQALPMLRDIIDRENDVLLRRAAAAGMRQLQTPESVPVMERMLVNPSEDRYVRLSAAVGLADSGKPLGVTGLTQIFDESTADGRGREMAFRALANLKDERALPFMRQVAGSQAEPNYRLQAIRFLSAQGDQQSLGTLQALMTAPNEQASIRDAAAQAYSAIGGK